MLDHEKDPIATQLDKQYEFLKGKRTTWERNWQEIAEYVLPHRSDFTSKRSKGEERLEMAFEGTAMRLLKRFASNIHNVFTPMGAEWWISAAGTCRCSILPALKQKILQHAKAAAYLMSRTWHKLP